MSELDVYTKFKKALESEDREACLKVAHSALESKDVGIVQLYTEVIARALNEMDLLDMATPEAIWHEHVRSSIVRSVLESSYPFVLEERKAKGKGKAVVICPTEEYHEIGARMVADFLVLLGYDVVFVGANTPLKSIIAGVKGSQPKIVALSITNVFNLLAARRVTDELLTARKTMKKKFTLVVGGSAFKSNPHMAKEMGADELVQSFEDLKTLGGGK